MDHGIDVRPRECDFHFFFFFFFWRAHTPWPCAAPIRARKWNTIYSFFFIFHFWRASWMAAHTVATHIHARTHTCHCTGRTSFWEMYSIKYRYFPIHHAWLFFRFSPSIPPTPPTFPSVSPLPRSMITIVIFMFFCRWEERIWMRQKCIFAVHINRIARSSTMALVACHAILACMWLWSEVMGYCILLATPSSSSTKHPFIRPFASILNINWHLRRHRFTNTHTQYIPALDGNWNAHLMLNERTRPCGDVCRMWILHFARGASDSERRSSALNGKNGKREIGEKRNYYFEQEEVWDALGGCELRTIFVSGNVDFVHFECRAQQIKHQTSSISYTKELQARL